MDPPKLLGVPDRARLLQFTPYVSEGSTRIVLIWSAPVRFETIDASYADSPTSDGRMAPSGKSIAVDFFPAVIDSDLSMNRTGLTTRLRLEQGTPDRARLRIDLAASSQHRVFRLYDPFRTVIDIQKNGPEASGSGVRRVRIERVAIDPGHGGSDPGTTSLKGLREKDVTLDVAHRVAPILARELRLATILTRDGDESIPLDARVARANAFRADLFVSIHCNSAESPNAAGFMTFVLDRAKEESATLIAARENASSASSTRQVAEFEVDSQSSDNRGASADFARFLQIASGASLVDRGRRRADLGIRGAGFFVLAGARMPSVLYEPAFLSSPIEAELLGRASFRQKIADAIANAIRAYQVGRPPR